jgi:hypothetical protein
VTANRAVVAAIVLLAGAAVVDGVRETRQTPGRAARDARAVIDLASSREAPPVPLRDLRAAFPRPRPVALAVSKVAVAHDELTAVGVSSVPGPTRARAAIELWAGDRLVRSFPVPTGSFSRGLWFTTTGALIATAGWDGRGYLYDRDGRPSPADAFVAYETG